MALATDFYSRQQFEAAIKAETTTGTKNVATMQKLNIDDWSIDSGTERFLGIRHGVGRTKKLADAYVESKGNIKTLSLSGLYDTTMGTIFWENVCNLATGSTPASVDIPGTFTGTVATWGTAAISDNIHTLTAAVTSPITDKIIILPGCIVNRFKIMATAGEDGGRFHFEADLVTKGEWDSPATTLVTPTAYPAVTTHRTIYDLNSATGVQQLADNDVSIYKVELEVIANVAFVGVGTNGVYDHAYRAAPNFDVNLLIGCKYDTNTEPLFAKQRTENTIKVEMHNAVWASATFGFYAQYCQIAEDFDVADVEGGAYFDVPLTALAETGATDVIQIIP
jgi:hypothetical protein